MEVERYFTHVSRRNPQDPSVSVTLSGGCTVAVGPNVAHIDATATAYIKFL